MKVDKYINALDNLLGVDHAYYSGDENVDAIMDAILALQTLAKENEQLRAQVDPFWFCTFGGCEGVCKACKDSCEMSIFVQERKKVLTDLHTEFSRYKCYEHAAKYVIEYAEKHNIKLEKINNGIKHI